MFEFFKDIANEYQGIDSESARKLRMAKRETEAGEKYIFSKGMKRIVYLFGCLYLISAISILVMYLSSGKINSYVIQYGLLSIVDLTALISLLTKTKRGEVISIGAIALFIVGLAASSVLM